MSKDKEQAKLFNQEIEYNWQKEWQGMPEFDQKDLTSFHQIIVHFEKIEDIEDFTKVIGQKITTLTRSIWFPKLTTIKPSTMRYIDEEAKK